MAGQDEFEKKLGKYVAVELTGTCPCHCEFCYKITKEGISLQLDTDKEISEFLTVLKEGGVESINWTGGEPTWCKNLAMILKIAKHQFGFTNILSTCGLLEHHNRLMERVILNYWQGIQFDLDYVSISHDGLHSQGQPEAAQKFLEWYREGRFSFRLKVNTLVAKTDTANTITRIANDILPTVCVWNLIEYVPREHSGKACPIQWLSRDEMKQAFADAIDRYRGRCLATPAFKFHNDDAPYHILLITPNAAGSPAPIRYWLPVKDGYEEFDPAYTGNEKRAKLSKGKTTEQESGCQFDASANQAIYSRYEHSGFEAEYCRYILDKISRSVERLLLEGCSPEHKEDKRDTQDQITSPFLQIPVEADRIQEPSQRYDYLCKNLFVDNEQFTAWIRQVTGIYYAGLFFRQWNSDRTAYTRISVTQAMDNLFVSPVFFSSFELRNKWLMTATGSSEKEGYKLLRALDDRCESVERDPQRVGKGTSINPAPISFSDMDIMQNWQFARLATKDSSHVSFRKIGTLDNLELWTFFCTENNPDKDRTGPFGAFISFMEGLAIFLLQFAYAKFSAANEASRIEQERAETLQTVDDRVIQLIDDIETMKSRAVTLRQIVRPDGPVFCERAKDLIPLFDHGKQVGLVIRRVKDNSPIKTSDLDTEILSLENGKSSDYFVEIARYTPAVADSYAVTLTSSHNTASVDAEHFNSFMQCIRTFGAFVNIPLLKAFGTLNLTDVNDKGKLKELVKLLCQRQIAPSETKDKQRVIYDAQLVCYLLNEFNSNVKYGEYDISITGIETAWRNILIPESSPKEKLTSPVFPINVPVVAKLPRLKKPIDVLAPLCALVKELSSGSKAHDEANISSIQITSDNLTTKVHLKLNKSISASTLHCRSESLEGKHGLSSPLHRLYAALGQEYIHETAVPTDAPGVRIVNSGSDNMIQLVFEKDINWSAGALTTTGAV